MTCGIKQFIKAYKYFPLHSAFIPSVSIEQLRWHYDITWQDRYKETFKAVGNKSKLFGTRNGECGVYFCLKQAVDINKIILLKSQNNYISPTKPPSMPHIPTSSKIKISLFLNMSINLLKPIRNIGSLLYHTNDGGITIFFLLYYHVITIHDKR